MKGYYSWLYICQCGAHACSFSLFVFHIPDENKEFFLALQHMIEEMAEKAGRPVVLIAHSMGNMYTLYFLNQQPQAWKDKYIKAFISLGPPWAGVAKTLRVLSSGERMNWFILTFFLVWLSHRFILCCILKVPYLLRLMSALKILNVRFKKLKKH